MISREVREAATRGVWEYGMPWIITDPLQLIHRYSAVCPSPCLI